MSYPEPYNAPQGGGAFWRTAAVASTLVILGLLIWSGWRADQGHEMISRTTRDESIMGTVTEITATGDFGDQEKLDLALGDAIGTLRKVEALMSVYLAQSQLSQFNNAPVGQAVELSPEIMGLLRTAQEMTKRTGGAFDPTCRPILTLWKQAAREKRLPTDEQIAAALKKVGWDKISLQEGAAVKLAPSDGVDLGGIAKGYAADMAAKAMQARGVRGGLVNVGGNMRCFGTPKGGGQWRIGIRNPFWRRGASPATDDDGEMIGRLQLGGGAISTSGDYERFVEIAGKRYSHIVDPRTGRPVDTYPSVTVVAADGAVADAWSTALSVLGPQGLDLLRGEGVEAMIVTSANDDQVPMTVGFGRLLMGPIHFPPMPSTAPAVGQ
ncbi:MAG: FAD:protein FMN transferase [Planctomycetaceae bacterium]|nr:FAD:protein FMN transferase [Planctomycetaceae bacterium]